MTSSSLLVLSLFPGIGLLDRAFEDEGFCVVRGPDLLWGGDIKRFHPRAETFDGIIGGPPCQEFSPASHLARHRGYTIKPNLIPEFERCISEARPLWFLMENVRSAPEPHVEGYHTHARFAQNRWFGAKQSRLRRFTFGRRDGITAHLTLEGEALMLADSVPTILARGARRCTSFKLSGGGKPKCRVSFEAFTDDDLCELQGLPRDFFGDRKAAVFSAAGRQMMIGNGVPLPMGRAIARAVKRALADEVGDRAEMVSGRAS